MAKLTGPVETHAANEWFVKHLFGQQRHLFTFLRREGIDATNYRAEQALETLALTGRQSIDWLAGLYRNEGSTQLLVAVPSG